MTAEPWFLVVDDEQEVCNFFSYLLQKKGYRVATANSGRQALERLKDHRFNVALVDLKLPDLNGIEILREIKKVQPACEVIIITGYSTVKSAVEAIQSGAFDYVEKPFGDIDEMEKLLERALDVRAELERLSLSHKELGFVAGKNKKMLSLIAASRKIANKNITVLIQGETGTGKEVMARYIHSVSHRSDRPFMAFNCGAFTETLLESELFGHEKGSFTGATSKKKGIFEMAHKGTLFLDEIDSASPAIQIKLLRVLETGDFLRVGGEELCKVDVRVIAATNADLAARVEENRFREDLFYRLDVASLVIPPLRERAEDIPLFVSFFLEKERGEKGADSKKFSSEAMELLQKHTWPGNIRELANTVAQAVLLSKGQLIGTDDLPARIKPDSAEAAEKEGDLVEESAAVDVEKEALFRSHPQGKKLDRLLGRFEYLLTAEVDLKEGFDFSSLQEDLKTWRERVAGRIIELALEITFGNQVKAAELLGITPRALRYYLEKAKQEA
ncbi:MAG: sigma-54-dependent Fis family transcriptional regulator [Firmicutes bacterium]|nr:sigma-54-dependent Fis family transcriptional regulator [Bacillota bacterium]